MTCFEGSSAARPGYDNDSGWCLIEVAERDGNTMIAVTLDGVAPDDWYDDNRVLLDYALDAKAEREARRRPDRESDLGVSRSRRGGDLPDSGWRGIGGHPARVSGRCACPGCRKPVRARGRIAGSSDIAFANPSTCAGRRIIGRLREHLGCPRCRGAGHRGAGLRIVLDPVPLDARQSPADRRTWRAPLFHVRDASSPGPDRDRPGTKIVDLDRYAGALLS